MIESVGILDMDGSLPISLRLYRDHVKDQLETLGTRCVSDTEVERAVLWYPWAAGGVFPHQMPALHSQIPFVVTVHGVGPRALGPRYYYRNPSEAVEGSRWQLNYLSLWLQQGWRIDRVIAPSVAASREIIELLGYPESNIDVIHHGVDHQRFCPVGVKAETEIGFLSVSQWQPKKNLDRMVDAYGQLPVGRRPPLTIISPGYQPRALPPGVQVIRQPIAYADLASYYRSAVAFICPSAHETFALPIAEAMACGCPVAASNLPAIREVYGNAFLSFEWDRQDSLKEALWRLMDSSETRSGLVEAGLSQVEGLTWEASARAHLASFEEAKRGRDRRSRRGRCFLVLGMHRGGTSAVAGTLKAAGIDFGDDHLPNSESNLGGYTELAPVVRLNDELLAELGTEWHQSGLLDARGNFKEKLDRFSVRARQILESINGSPQWGVKDPRMGRLLPFWKPIVKQCAQSVVAVIVVRHPESVAASLERRDGITAGEAMRLWLSHMLAIDKSTCDMQRVIVDYDRLVRNPDAELEQLCSRLDLQESVAHIAAMTSSVKASWRHHHKTALAPAPGALDVVYETWRCLLEEADHCGHRSTGLDWCQSAGELLLDQAESGDGAYARWQAFAATWHRAACAVAPSKGDTTLHGVCLVPPGRDSSCAATLQSLLEQDDPNWHLTILTSSPPDRALSHGDPRVEWRRVENPTIRDANRCLQATPHRWAGFIDSGDRLHPMAVRLCRHFLEQHRGVEVLYTDEDQIDVSGVRFNPHFKSGFNLDLLRAQPYMGGWMLIREDLLHQLQWDEVSPGAEDYEIGLRLWEKRGSQAFRHLPDVLYHRATDSVRVDVPVERMVTAAGEVLERHIKRCSPGAQIVSGPLPVSFRVEYPVSRATGVSIIVPASGSAQQIQRCVESVLAVTHYPSFDIILTDFGTDEPELRRFLDGIAEAESELEGKVKVVGIGGQEAGAPGQLFDVAVKCAREEFVLFLHAASVPIQSDWLHELVTAASSPDVVAVGAKIVAPDGATRHAGLIKGLQGNMAGRMFYGQRYDLPGYFGRAQLRQTLEAVSTEVILTRASDYLESGGLQSDTLTDDCSALRFCERLSRGGRRIVFAPDAKVLRDDAPQAVQAPMADGVLTPTEADRFYSPNLSLRGTRFEINSNLPPPRYLSRVTLPRILAHPADSEGCGEYRVMAAARELSSTGRAEVHISHELAVSAAEVERLGASAIVLQRQIEKHQLEAIRRYRKHSDAFLVFEIDDLISNLPVHSAHRQGIPADVMTRMRDAIGLCDRLVVATEPLAEAYGQFCREVIVRPNYLPRRLWGDLEPKGAMHKKPRVGWAGGIGHSGDLGLIAPVVEALADEVDWVFFGMCPESLRRFVKDRIPAVPVEIYPGVLAQLDLDLALAPLEDIPFNRAKSHLRLLEYGACGYPVIASDICPYRMDLPITRVGWRMRDWIKAIRERLAEPEALAKEGRQLRSEIRNRWMLDGHLDEALRAWMPDAKVPGRRDVINNAECTSAIEIRQVGRTTA